MLPFKRYRNHTWLMLLFGLLYVVSLPLNAYASNESPSNTALEKAMDTAMASLEEPTPEGIQRGVDALNAIPDQGEFTVSQKMQVFQQLLDTAIQSIEQGFDQYPVPVKQMTEDVSDYQITLTHTSLPEFNQFAKQQLDSLQANIEALPKRPANRNEPVVVPTKERVSTNHATPPIPQTLLYFLVGGLLFSISGWVLWKRKK